MAISRRPPLYTVMREVVLVTFNRIKRFEIRAFKDTHRLGWFYLEATEDPKKKFKMRTHPACLCDQWAHLRLLYAKENIDDLKDRIAQAEIGLKTHKRISLGEFQTTILQMHEAGFGVYKPTK